MVVDAVKAALKPYYAVGKITKDEYKDVMRSAVPKVHILPILCSLFNTLMGTGNYNARSNNISWYTGR